MADFRRIALFVTIGSFSVAALLGVLALLSGGDFGETEARILLTTLLVGVTSIAMLCYLATAETPHQLVGAVGGVCAIATLLFGLTLVWSDFDTDTEGIWQTFGIGSTVSASLAQVSLLLVFAATAAAYVRRLLAVTLVAVTWVALHVTVLILEVDAGDGSLRLLGVMAILDVLGTVAVAALAKFGGDTSKAQSLEVPADLVPLILARAEASGVSPEVALRSVLVSNLGSEDPAGRA